MKITPIEIRQHTFEKGLRGYRAEDVDAFLVSLSQEWERVTSDYKMLKMQLELAEKELNKLREVEMTLFRTLKTAEDTSTQITEQANKAAEQYLADARQKADEMLADARKRSTLMVQDAENQARYLKDNILNDMKALEHDFKALENYKENLAQQIRALASNAVDSVDRFEKKFAKQNLKGKIDEVTSQIKEESKQAENAVQPEPQAETSEQPVADLPPLVERETAIPEAIPVDEELVAKLDDAIHNADAAMPHGAERVVDDTVVESAAVQEQAATTEPTTEEPKKGGSFFDQI
ncbi:DivIVA domain-containing protein [Spirosoma montaniterrae]|uniref:Cell division protein DivIVA n=1 Tax=Spirosoma montaniterrae TaxID=1178516 RepID=A0A1P9X2F1_9BACT|nr:DivIVA domain-containing protein [Spirosoma montaniterrae]AQG81802.1 cell division protein DivIVA [Spirosoma montaniterrae]